MIKLVAHFEIREGYDLLTINGEPAIRCTQCQQVSYHPKDIAERYCGRCQKFHEEPAPGLSARSEPHDCANRA